MNYLRISSLLFPLLLVPSLGCRSSKGKELEANLKAAQTAAAEAEKIDTFVYDAPLFMAKGDLDHLRKLPTLKKESVEFKEGPNSEGEKLEFRTFEYEGLLIYGDVSEGTLRPIEIVVSSPRWEILHGLKVGSLASKVPMALGQGARSMNGPVEEFSGETETVRFTISQGRIQKIEFIYHFD